MTVPVQSLTISRDSLTLDPLVITNDPTAGAFHIPEDGLSRPVRSIRRTYAPDSAYVPGRVLLAAVEEAGSLPVEIYAKGVSTEALTDAIVELETALSQFTYDLTLSIDGQDATFSAEPELPSWGSVDSGMVRAHIARASVVIPLNPA